MPAFLRLTCWVLCLAGAFLGCTRKAPGPSECQALGLAVLGVDAETAAMMPRIQQAVDLFTVECLTTPYDRQLVQCMAQQAPPIPRSAARTILRCLMIPDVAHMGHCIRTQGPGRPCLMEFQLRNEEVRASREPDSATESRWMLSR